MLFWLAILPFWKCSSWRVLGIWIHWVCNYFSGVLDNPLDCILGFYWFLVASGFYQSHLVSAGVLILVLLVLLVMLVLLVISRWLDFGLLLISFWWVSC